MKKFVKCAAALVLIFCAGNAGLFPQAGEDWTEIDSYDELEGEWDGNAVSFVRGVFQNTEFESILDISMTFSYKKDDEAVLSFVGVDLSRLLTDLENLDEMKEKGFTKENLWEILKSALENDFFEFYEYVIIYENSAWADEYFASDANGKFLINGDKDALLLTYYEPSFILGIGDSGFTEMIFRRISAAP